MINSRQVRPIFALNGTASPPPNNPQCATVETQRRGLICVSYGCISIPSNPAFHSFEAFLTHKARISQMEWCSEFISIKGDLPLLIDALLNDKVSIVSDGSYIPSFATAAFVMEDLDQRCMIKNKVIAPGGPKEMSAYRAEVTGLLTSIYIVNQLCEFFNITGGRVKIGCDGEAALFQSFHQATPKSVEAPSFDLIMAIHRLRVQSNVQ